MSDEEVCHYKVVGNSISWVACGSFGYQRYLNQSADKLDVTCKRCKQTRDYNQTEQEKSYENRTD